MPRNAPLGWKFAATAVTTALIGGCPARGLFAGIDAPEDDELVGAPDEDECEVDYTRNDLTVTRTGETRVINDFPVEEYRVEWVMEFEDEQERKTTNVVSSTVWTTREGGAVPEAMRLESAYAATDAAATDSGALAPLHKAFPVEALNLIDTRLADHLAPARQAEIAAAATQGDDIEGLPISTKVEWNAKAEACDALEREAAAREEDDDVLDTSSGKGFLASIGQQVLRQKVDDHEEAKRAEIAMRPIFGYVREVKSIETEPVRLSKMAVPGDYDLDDRD